MLRLSLLGFGLLATTACTWDLSSPFGPDETWGWDTAGGSYEQYLRGTPDGVTQESSLWAAAEGIAFTETGTQGVAGLASMACRFETSTGYIDLDLDVAEGTETVDDGESTGQGGIVIASTTDDGVQVTTFGDYDGRVTDQLSLPGAFGARFTDDGIVAMQDDAGCRVFRAATGDSQMLGATCADFDVADDGRVFAIADGSLTIAYPNGVVADAGVSANLLAFDPIYNHVYTALRGGNTVEAVTPSGETVWSTEVDGRITTLDALGGRGEVLVGLSIGSEGRILVLDGATGAIDLQADAYDAPEAVWASPSGDVFAVKVGWNTHMLRLR